MVRLGQVGSTRNSGVVSTRKTHTCQLLKHDGKIPFKNKTLACHYYANVTTTVGWGKPGQH